MLGPPVCLNCMRIMDGYKRPDETVGHKYWRCDKCGIDCNDEKSSNLFGMSEEKLDVILADRPKLRRIMDRLREINSRR